LVRGAWPPAATAFSTIASTPWRLSSDRQSSASISFLASTIRFEVKSAKCSRLRIMKTIVSDQTIAAAEPGLLKRVSFVKPMAS
jgi:hypothetical protein